MTTPTAAPTAELGDTSGIDFDFDLNLTIVTTGPVVAGLMGTSNDNCGNTCQSACSNSTC